MNPMLPGGQMRTKTRPMTADSSIGPQTRESLDALRLSPIMK
jgi:hypothetical protein